MIIPEKNIVFIHIPKTGGSSIAAGLFKTVGLKYNSYSSFSDSIQEKYWCTGSLKHTKGYNLVNYTHWDSCYVFSIVRNPYSRIHSQYNWWKQTSNSKCINTFVEEIKHNPLYSNQIEWLQRGAEMLADDTFDYDDITYLFKHLGIKYNHTKRGRYNVEMDLDNIVEDYYWKDLEYWGFEKGKSSTKNSRRLINET